MQQSCAAVQPLTFLSQGQPGRDSVLHSKQQIPTAHRTLQHDVSCREFRQHRPTHKPMILDNSSAQEGILRTLTPSFLNVASRDGGISRRRPRRNSSHAGVTTTPKRFPSTALKAAAAVLPVARQMPGNTQHSAHLMKKKQARIKQGHYSRDYHDSGQKVKW